MTTLDIATSSATFRKNGLLLVLSAGVLWSTVGLGVRLIEDAVVWQILLYRSVSLSLFLFCVLTIRNQENPFRQVRRAGMPAVVGGLALVGAYAGGIYAIQATSVAAAMLLFATAPFLTAILGWFVLGEPVRRATWVAIIVAMAGIAVMVADKVGETSLSGSLAALGSAFGFSIFTIALRWGKSGEMLPAVFLSGVFGAIFMASMCWLLGLTLVISTNDGAIALGMGVFQVGLGLVLYTVGSKALPAAELTLLSLAEVLLAPIWVWLVLGETATSSTLGGGAILLVAIIGNAISGARRSPPIIAP